MRRLTALWIPIFALVACEDPGEVSDNHIEGTEALIVSADEMMDEVQPLADWRCRSGVPTRHVALSDALDAGDGADDAARLKDYIRQVWEEGQLRYVLLAGDADNMPYRTVDVSVDIEAEDTYEVATVASDLYYADLDGDWDPDGDGVWGELSDDADLLPDVAVGRLPVEEWDEIRGYVDKLLTYEQSPDLNYLDRVALVASYAGMGVYASVGMEMYIAPHLPEGLEVTRLYEDAENYEGAELLTADSYIETMEDGQNLIFQMGHGNEETMGPLWTIDEVNDIHNPSRPTILVTTECLGGRFDYSMHDTSGEEFVHGNEGGVAYIGHSNLGIGFPSFSLVMKDMASSMYADGDEPNRLGEVLAAAMRGYSDHENLHTEAHPDRWNQFVITLLGDPALTFFTEAPIVVEMAVETLGKRGARVTVTDLSGDAVEGAVVTAHLPGEFLHIEHTDSAGQATLAGEDKSFQDAQFTVSGRGLIPTSWIWTTD